MNTHSNIADIALVKEYKQTYSQDVLAKLYKDYISLVYGVGLKYLKDKTDAEDLTMTVYEHISKKLKTHEVDNFRAWLYVVTKNLCYEKLRKKSRILDKEKDALLMYSETVFHPDDVTNEETLIQLRNCMQKLKLEQRQCVEDFYFNTLSYNVIADKYQLSWNRVRSYIQNGRRMLKNCIENNA